METTKRNRSPNYPVISLKSALDYLEKLYAFANGQHAVPMMAAINEAWGMKPGSAYGKQVVGALKAFGLIEDQGSGTARKIRVTDAGAKIRGGHSTRDELIRKAALSPTVHQELWREFAKEGQLPPAASLRQYLLFDRDGNRFNEAAVGPFIDEFVETINFAKLNAAGGSSSLDTPNNGNGHEALENEVQVGSLIQWNSGGAQQFPRPRRVRKVTADGKWVFVDDSDTGIPTSEVCVVGVAEAMQSTDNVRAIPPVDPVPLRKGSRRESIMLEEGPLSIEWPENISSDSVGDVEEWSKLFLKRLKRSVGKTHSIVETTVLANDNHASG